MNREISAGFIIFRKTTEGVKFLLLYHRGGYWNFPKGKIEKEERSFEAAFRETQEETGLKKYELRPISGFKINEKYFFRKEGKPIFKIVIFYLASTQKREIIISSEHNGYGWFLFKEALSMVKKYKDTQKVLTAANDFLKKTK